MRSGYVVADADGKVARAGEGCGFAVLPGRARGATHTRPGSYPLTVVTRRGERIEVTGPHAYYFSRSGPMKFDLVGAAPFSGWNVVAFDAPEEGVRPGAGTRLTSRVQSASAASAAAPVDGDASGFEVRPGTSSWTAYAAGVLQAARLWVQDLDGVWTDTGEDVDFTASPVVTRLVDTVGRVYLRAAAPLTLAIDVTEQVG